MKTMLGGDVSVKPGTLRTGPSIKLEVTSRQKLRRSVTLTPREARQAGLELLAAANATQGFARLTGAASSAILSKIEAAIKEATS